jgi:hypothetical protein
MVIVGAIPIDAHCAISFLIVQGAINNMNAISAAISASTISPAVVRSR